MARSDSLRKEIARLNDKKASYAKLIAAQAKIAVAARGAARKKREHADRSSNASIARSALTAAERQDKKVADAEGKIAKARKDSAAADKAITSKTSLLRTAVASERKSAESAQRRLDTRRRREEMTHTRAVVRASAPPTQIRYVEVEHPGRSPSESCT